jgi:hypothetical protein
MRQSWLLLSILLWGCGGEAPPAETPKTQPAAEPKEEAPAAKTFKLDPAELAKAAEEIALVPSPAEMQKALSNAGLQAKLAEMVASDKDITMEVENKDQLAVRTGVVLADLVLTVKTSSKELLLARLAKLKVGFEKLGAGSDIQATIDEMSTQITNDAINRDDLLKEIDELSGVMVPELEYEAGEWVVPLIQAGSWLEGAHLVSNAIKTESKFDSADKLLKQPAVVDYFLKYVQREGREKADDQVVAQLESTLLKLKEVANSPKIDQAGVEAIFTSTSDVLKLL